MRALPRTLVLLPLLLLPAAAPLAGGRAESARGELWLLAGAAASRADVRRELERLPAADRVALEVEPGAARSALGELAGAVRLLGHGPSVEDVRAVRTARSLVLAGGDYVDWWRVLTPDNDSSSLARAIRHAHLAGVPVVAHGGAACFAGRSAVFEIAADAPTANPRDRGETAAAGGLGLCDALVEVDAGAGGLRAALRAAVDGRQPLGLVLLGDAACGLRSGDLLAVHGPGRVVVFGLRRARDLRGRVMDVELALLHAGDRFDLERLALLGARPAPTRGEAARRPVDDALGPAELSRLASEGGGELADAVTGIRLERQGGFSRNHAGGATSWAGLRLSVWARDGAGDPVPRR